MEYAIKNKKKEENTINFHKAYSILHFITNLFIFKIESDSLNNVKITIRIF